MNQVYRVVAYNKANPRLYNVRKIEKRSKAAEPACKYRFQEVDSNSRDEILPKTINSRVEHQPNYPICIALCMAWYLSSHLFPFWLSPSSI